METDRLEWLPGLQLCRPVIDTHFVLVTTGSSGDLFPFLKLGTELKARGHQVTLFAPSLHQEAVRQAGLAFHGCYANPDVLADPDLWHPRRGFGVVWRAVRPGLRELLPLLRALPAAQPVVIVAHPLALPDAALCRALRPGVRVVAAYLAPSNIPTVYDPLMIGPLPIARWVPHRVRRWIWNAVAKRLIDPAALPDVNAQRVQHGLAPVASLFALMHSAPDLSVTLFPSWFGQCQPDWPSPLCAGDFTLYDPNPQAAFTPELERFLAAGAPPLVFTHGTGNQQAGAYFAHALAAVQRLGARAIFLTPHREQVPASLPPGVLWQAYLPFKKLLPLAAALVHHGGIGSTAEALRAGVPQLIVPLAYDQFDNGARVMALGAGLVLRHSRLNGRKLCAKLRQLMACTSIPVACGALQARMAHGDALGGALDAIVSAGVVSGS